MLKIAHVYHNIKLADISLQLLADRDLIPERIALLDSRAFFWVAAVVVDSDETAVPDAFSRTNTIKVPWMRNGLVLAGSRAARSTSAGDLVEYGGRLHLILPKGFAEVPNLELPYYREDVFKQAIAIIEKKLQDGYRGWDTLAHHLKWYTRNYDVGLDHERYNTLKVTRSVEQLRAEYTGRLLTAIGESKQ